MQKVQCHAIQCFMPILRSKMAARILAAAAPAPTDKLQSAPFFFFFKFGASHSTDVGVYVSCMCKVVPVSHEIRFWELIKKVGMKRRGCPAMADMEIGRKLHGIQSGVKNSTDRSSTLLVRPSFRCSCVDFTEQYNVQCSEPRARHLFRALRLETARLPLIFLPKNWRQKSLNWVASVHLSYSPTALKSSAVAKHVPYRLEQCIRGHWPRI